MLDFALAAASFAFICYAVLNLNARPGLFAGISVNTYALSAHFGSIGPFVAVVAILAGLSGWSRNGPTRSAEIVLFAWIALSLVTIPFSPQIDIAASYGVALLFLSVSGFLFGRAWGEKSDFMRDILISACVVVVLCEPTIAASSRENASRISGDLNAVGVSELADIPVVGCLAFLLLDRTLVGWRKLSLVAFLFLVILPVAASFGTRGVFIGAAPATLLLLGIRIAQGRLVQLLTDIGWLALLLAIAGYLAWTFLPITHVVAAVVPHLLANLAGSGQALADDSTLQRLRFYDEATRLFWTAPFLGHGLGSFSYLANYANNTYPHNAILEILVNSGVVGLSLFLVAVAMLFRTAFAEALLDKRAESWLLVALLVYTFTRLQISESITHGKLFFLLLGVAAARYSVKAMATNTPPTEPTREHTKVASA